MIPCYAEYESEYIRQIILKVIGEENAKALSKISICRRLVRKKIDF